MALAVSFLQSKEANRHLHFASAAAPASKVSSLMLTAVALLLLLLSTTMPHVGAAAVSSGGAPAAPATFAGWGVLRLGGRLQRVGDRSSITTPAHFPALGAVLQQHVEFVSHDAAHGDPNATSTPAPAPTTAAASSYTGGVPKGDGLVRALANLAATAAVIVEYEPSCECATRGDDPRFVAAFGCAGMPSNLTAGGHAASWLRCSIDMASAVESLRCVFTVASAAIAGATAGGDTSFTDQARLHTAAMGAARCVLNATFAAERAAAYLSESPAVAPAARVVGRVSLLGHTTSAASNATAINATLRVWNDSVAADGVWLADARLASPEEMACGAVDPSPTALGSRVTALAVLERKNFLRRVASAAVAMTTTTTPWRMGWVGLQLCRTEYSSFISASSGEAELVATEALSLGSPVLVADRDAPPDAMERARNTSAGFVDALAVAGAPLSWASLLEFAGAATVSATIQTSAAHVRAALAVSGGSSPQSADGVSPTGVQGLSPSTAMRALAGVVAGLSTAAERASPIAASYAPRLVLAIQSLAGAFRGPGFAATAGTARSALATALAAPTSTGWAGSTASSGALAAYGVAVLADVPQSQTNSSAPAHFGFVTTVGTAAAAASLGRPAGYTIAAHAALLTSPVDGNLTRTAAGAPTFPAGGTVSRGGRTVFVDVSTLTPAVPYARVSSMFGGTWPVPEAPKLAAAAAGSSSSSWFDAAGYANIGREPATWPNLHEFLRLHASPVRRLVFAGAESVVADDAGIASLSSLVVELGARRKQTGLREVCVAWLTDGPLAAWDRLAAFVRHHHDTHAGASAAVSLCVMLVPGATFGVNVSTGAVRTEAVRWAAVGDTVKFFYSAVADVAEVPRVFTFIPPALDDAAAAMLARSSLTAGATGIAVGAPAWGSANASAAVARRLAAVGNATNDIAASSAASVSHPLELVPVMPPAVFASADGLAMAGLAPPTTSPTRLSVATADAACQNAAKAVAAMLWSPLLLSSATTAPATVPSSLGFSAAAAGATMLSRAAQTVRAALSALSNAAAFGTRRRAKMLSAGQSMQRRELLAMADDGDGDVPSTPGGVLCARFAVARNSLRIADQTSLGEVHAALAAEATSASAETQDGAAVAVAALSGAAIADYPAVALGVLGPAAMPDAGASVDGAACGVLPRTRSGTASGSPSLPLPTPTPSHHPTVTRHDDSQSVTPSTPRTRSRSLAATPSDHATSRTQSTTVGPAAIALRPTVFAGATIRDGGSDVWRTLVAAIPPGTRHALDPGAFVVTQPSPGEPSPPDPPPCSVQLLNAGGGDFGLRLLGSDAALLLSPSGTPVADSQVLRVVAVNATAVSLVLPPKRALKLLSNASATVSLSAACFAGALPPTQADVRAVFTVTANAKPVPPQVPEEAVEAAEAAGSTASAIGGGAAAVLGGAVATTAVTASRGRMLLETARCRLSLGEELPFMAHPFAFALNIPDADTPDADALDPTRYYLGSAVGNVALMLGVVLLAGAGAAYIHCTGRPAGVADPERDGDPFALEMQALSPSRRHRSSSNTRGGSKRRNRRQHADVTKNGAKMNDDDDDTDFGAAAAAEEDPDEPLLDAWLRTSGGPPNAAERAAAARRKNGTNGGKKEKDSSAKEAKRVEHERRAQERQARIDEQTEARKAIIEARLRGEPDPSAPPGAVAPAGVHWKAAFARTGFPAALMPLVLLLVQDTLVGTFVPLLHSPFVMPRVIAGILFAVFWLPLIALVGLAVTTQFSAVFIRDGTTQEEQRALAAVRRRRIAKFGMLRAARMPPVKLSSERAAEVRFGVHPVKPPLELFFLGGGEWQDDSELVERAETVAVIPGRGATVAGPSSSPAARRRGHHHQQQQPPIPPALVRRFVPWWPALFHPRGFCGRFAALFGAYARDSPYFIGIELSVAGVFAVFVAMQPTFEDIDHGCAIAWGIIGAVFLLYLVLAVATRPFAAGWEFVFATAIALCQIVIAACVAAYHGLGGTNLALLEAADTTVLVLLFLPLGKLVVDVLFHLVYLRCVKPVANGGHGHGGFLFAEDGDAQGGGHVGQGDLAAAERQALQDESATDSDALWSSSSSTFSGSDDDGGGVPMPGYGAKTKRATAKNAKRKPTAGKHHRGGFAHEDPDLMPASSDNDSAYNGGGGAYGRRGGGGRRRASDGTVAARQPRHNPLQQQHARGGSGGVTRQEFCYMPGFDPATAAADDDHDGDDAELAALRSELARLRGGSARASTRTANVTLHSAPPQQAPRRDHHHHHPPPPANVDDAYAYDLL